MKNNLKSITLEMSLKPFYSTEPEAVEAVCIEAFTQWGALLRHTDTISVLLWTSDGSEILEYTGDQDKEMEWARYMGAANHMAEWDPQKDPKKLGLHVKRYLYREHPAVITGRILKEIVQTLKDVGRRITGKPIRVGETFDPGPEFAESKFKYMTHREALLGDTRGRVCCYALLQEDHERYAAFPDGIPEGLPMGTFLGRQCQRFLSDMGFDYLWLSNGFGFGCETWGTTGVVFDGTHFSPELLEPTQEKILEFWKLFRAECDFRVETRGTNLTVGIDLASDAVNLDKIYQGGFDILPPPNSPWAALDGDFGLELAGYMSRIAELPPEGDYLFRYYVHDPWWMNSPWLDRYEGQPHDIYLPLAVVRMDEQGKAKTPNYLNLLTIDNSLGEMPEQCPNEVIPHLLKGLDNLPDAASPFVWIYPFDEYNSLAAGRAEKPFFEDWFIRGAINHGLPLSTVVSTDNFLKSYVQNPMLYLGAVLVTAMPEEGSAILPALCKHVEGGGRVLFYGSAQDAPGELLQMLNLSRTLPLEGKLSLHVNLAGDTLHTGEYGKDIFHDALLSDGGIDTVLLHKEAPSTNILATVSHGSESRVVALYRSLEGWGSGAVAWVRGTNCSYWKEGTHILTPFDTEAYYPLEYLMRLAVGAFGYTLAFTKESPRSKDPVIMIHRHQKRHDLFRLCPRYHGGYAPSFPAGCAHIAGMGNQADRRDVDLSHAPGMAGPLPRIRTAGRGFGDLPAGSTGRQLSDAPPRAAHRT